MEPTTPPTRLVWLGVLRLLLRLLLLLLLVEPSHPAQAAGPIGPIGNCPDGCFCDDKKAPHVPGQAGLKIQCHPLARGVAMDWSSFPAHTVQLDLAKYGLSELNARHLAAMPYLQKLDLQNNELAHIDEEAFAANGELELIDLSLNHLEVVTSEVFRGLPKLTRLKLSDNRIQTVEQGAFRHLSALQRLELNDNPFICDCHLAWFLRWLEARPEVLAHGPKTQCALPIAYAQAPLQKVLPAHLSCGTQARPEAWPEARPEAGPGPPSGIVRLIPGEKQIAFRGDTLEIQCQAQKQFPQQKIQWLIRGRPIFGDSSESISVSEHLVPNSDLHQSTIVVQGVEAVHSGEWACFLEDDSNNRANFRALNVLVASKVTHFCPPMSSKTSRGVYTWGMAIGGSTLTQECQRNLEDRDLGFAFFFCRETGEWSAHVNTSQCGYTNHVTDTLHKFAFATMNLTLTPKLLLQSAQQFLNFTDHPEVFKDEMDVVYFAQAVENYLPYLSRSAIDLGRYIMSMVENVLHVEPDLMGQAQLRDQACTTLLSVVSNVTRVVRSFTHYTKDLAIETYDIKPNTFDGVTCTWYRSQSESTTASFPSFSSGGKVFHCSQTNQTVPSSGKVVLASVAIPKSIYQQIQQMTTSSRGASSSIYPEPMGMVAFDKPNLFPTTQEHPDYNPVTAPVIGAHYSQPLGLLNEPVSVVIRSEDFHESNLVQPVYWDPESNGGFGSWQAKNCQLIRSKAGLIWFTCNKLGYYSYRLSKLTGVINASGHVMFKHHHPLIYVGSVVCIVLLLVSVSVYGISFHSIQISRQLKHALINIWAGMCSLIFVFTVGINQTEHHLTCILVGIASHYLTLCNLVWIVIAVHIIYQKANSFKTRQVHRHGNSTTAFLRPSQPDGLRASDRPLRRPIVRFYLLGWGVSAILCGLVAAVNVEHYTVSNHCLMKMTPFLVSVVLPGALLTAILVGFSLSAWCVATAGQIPEPLETESRSQRTTSMTSVVSHLLPDQEKTVRSLLLAHGYIYVLFLSTWMCGSLSVIQPLKGNLPHEQLVFAVLFTISSISLGVFVFVYFCASRHDVQECWRNPFCVADYLFSGHPELDTSSHLVHTQANTLPKGLGPSAHVSTLNHPSASDGGTAQRDKFLQNNQFQSGGSAFNVSQDGFQIYDSHTEGYHQHRHHHHHRQHPAAINGPRVKETNRVESGHSSDHLSLNNANHLRRGYVAPTNSALASEADYGYALFGPSSSKVNNVNIHVEPPTYRRDKVPKNSSPMAGHPGIGEAAHDLTMSPLQQQQPLPRLDERMPESLYTESSTIKVGAPCQLASFTASEFPGGGVHSPKNRGSSLGPRPGGGYGKKKFHPRHQPLPEDEDAIVRASDLDLLETQSKASSSVYSNRSNLGRPRKRHKKPTRKKRSRSELEANRSLGWTEAKMAEDRQPLEEDYQGEREEDDDDEPEEESRDLVLVRNELNRSKDEEPCPTVHSTEDQSQKSSQTESPLIDPDFNGPLDEELPNRETSV